MCILTSFRRKFEHGNGSQGQNNHRRFQRNQKRLPSPKLPNGNIPFRKIPMCPKDEWYNVSELF